MSTITIERRVGGVLTNVTTMVLADATGTYGIRTNATGAAAVAANAAVTNSSTGIYSYDITALAAGDYTASWKATVGAVVDYTVQNFSVDAASAASIGVTLAAVERELAPLVGPYYEFVTAASGSSTTGVAISDLQSSIDTGDYDDLYVLRRGVTETADGVQTSIIGFAVGDRVRQVASYTAASGLLTVDRAWANQPATNERIELHHLHPRLELRRAALAGLKRCFFEDRVTASFTSAASERDLTAVAPWITKPSQLRRVATQYPGTIQLPSDVGWYKPILQAGHVWIQAARDPYPNSMIVTGLRPASTWVNGATSVVGPDDDTDLLAVDVAYAAAAAHCEAWRLFARRLLPSAQTGLQMTRQDASREFTKLSLERNMPKPQTLELGDPIGFRGVELV